MIAQSKLVFHNFSFNLSRDAGKRNPLQVAELLVPRTKNHFSSFELSFLNIFSRQNLLCSLSLVLFLLQHYKYGAKKCPKNHVRFDFSQSENRKNNRKFLCRSFSGTNKEDVLLVQSRAATCNLFKTNFMLSLQKVARQVAKRACYMLQPTCNLHRVTPAVRLKSASFKNCRDSLKPLQVAAWDCQGRISPYKFLVPCLSVRFKFTNQ